MKLSFSLSSKSQTHKTPKPTKPKSESHEYLTEFDPSQTPTNPNPQIIPPLPNNDEWRRCKNMKNIEAPLSSEPGPASMEFVTETSDVAAGSDNGSISYGLNLRKKENEVVENVDKVLLDKLRDDLERLPDMGGVEDYEEVPVEGFGKALLRGYGWREGTGIGKRAKGDVKVVEYSRRGNREGLGFDSKVEKGKGNRKRDNGHEKREQDRDNGDENREWDIGFEKRERKRGRENGDEKREHGLVGKDVRVVEGREVGMKGRVVEVSEDDRVVLRDSRSGEEVRVRIGKVAEIGTKEEAKCTKRLKEVKGNVSKNVSSGKNILWLRNHIRVKVICKELKRGRLYLKKAHVVDVVGPGICDITMDESKEMVQGVNQNVLQTALPARGGPVLVLFGKHKGVYGTLVEKDLGKESAVVQDADSHEMISVHLDQIAEYIGDPSYIGY